MVLLLFTVQRNLDQWRIQEFQNGMAQLKPRGLMAVLKPLLVQGFVLDRSLWGKAPGSSRILTSIRRFLAFKGIGSTCILFLKNGLKKNCRKNYKNHLRSNNYEVCTAVALCFPNILDLMVIENTHLSSDRNRVTLLWSNDADLDFCHRLYTMSAVYISTAR
jgi:hypothetical protein